jgi:predicted DNA-binding WGR domain protein
MQKEKLALEILEKEEEQERKGYSKQVKSKTENKIIEEVTKQYNR